jgi:hypothetical protein
MSVSGVANPPGSRMGSAQTRFGVLVLFVILSVLMTYPLVLHLSTAVPGPPWDNFVWLYDLWWFRHSIVDLGQWPTNNPGIFYPYGYDLRLSETMLANKALIAPVLFWGDEILAYNVLLLLGFVLTGYATYLLLAYLTGNPYAAVVGGAIFAFCPYRMHAMAAGWLPLLSTQWIPLTFLYLERTIREGKARYAVAAGLFLALNILSSWYYLYVVGGFVGVYLLLRLWPWKRALRERGLVRNLLLGGLVAGLLVLPVAWPVLTVSGGSMGWSLKDVEKWAASLDDFILPNVYHPLWGDYFLSLRAFTLRYPWYAPGFVYLGWVAVVLAVIGLRRGGRQGRVVPALFWLGALSFLLALGVALHWGNRVVAVRLPPQVERFLSRGLSTLMSKWALHKASYYDIAFESGSVPVLLPALFLYLFVPLGNTLRTMYRFGVMTVFAVAVLAGMGAASLLGGIRAPGEERAPRGRYDLVNGSARARPAARALNGAVVLLALVLLDFVSAPLAYGLSEVAPQPLDRWLAALPEDAVVMQFPLTRSLSGLNLYRQKYHGKKMAYGHGTFYPGSYQYALPTLGTFPSEESLALLKSWGVTHVLVGSGAYDAGWGDQRGQTWERVRAQIEASGRLRFVGVIYEQPLWRDERVSQVIYGSPPVVPVLVDKIYIYELH